MIMAPLIPEFFAGKEVLITGATGFLGKVLVERLLWTCPEISRLYLLIRQKRDVTPEKRLQEFKQCQVFDVIRENCPERLDKLSVVAGDVTKPMFNMDMQIYQQLSQVSIVFHSAANVRGNQTLDEAVEMNVLSIITLMDVCDRLPMMQVLVHVSTAYSNAERSHVQEIVYPARFTAQQLRVLLDGMPKDVLDDITPKLISPKPSTYTFTKAVAETVVADRAHSCNYATAIFRPSIVISSIKHPFPGWIDSVHGPGGFMIYIGKGLLRVMPCIGSKRAGLIPVDMAIDTLIACAWEVGIDNVRETRVYNCCSSENPTTWEQFRVRIIREVRQHPFDASLWYPFTYFASNRLFLRVSTCLLHLVPRYTMEFLYTIFRVNHRNKISSSFDRMQALIDVATICLMNEWQFSTDNVQRLKERLAEEDTVIYNLDPRSINWDSHCVDFVKGLRKFVLREKEKDLGKARTRMRMLYIIHRMAQCMIIFVVYQLSRSSFISGSAILRIIFSLITLNKTTSHRFYRINFLNPTFMRAAEKLPKRRA